MIEVSQLLQQLRVWLQPDLISDYCPNGLQVQGQGTIKHLVTGVTASQALIDKAIELNAQALLVHHGYFWKGEAPELTGMKYRRIKSLLDHNIHLLAYHLPIDVHPTLGNNAQLIQRLFYDQTCVYLGDKQEQELKQKEKAIQYVPIESVQPRGVLMLAQLPQAISHDELQKRIETQLGRCTFVSVAPRSSLSKVAVCTGGGQGYIEQAWAAGADAFITGEVSEQTVHFARENNINFYAAGHHATERYGVKAIGEQLQAELGIQVTFVDIDNPA